MNRFSRTEFLLLNYLYDKEIGTQSDGTLLETDLNLRENDEISRIREIVFYVEKLEREGFLQTDPAFYTESDHMSFTYLNSAVELNEDSIRLSDEGRRMIVQYRGSGGSARFFNALNRIMEKQETRQVLLVLSIVMVLLGVLIGYVIGRTF